MRQVRPSASITEAKHLGFTRLSPETGTAEFFLPARKLYEKFGFSYCEQPTGRWHVGGVLTG
ncbi:hypothetical protein DIZ27_34085 [Streptomyces sp. NWU339]|uniref:hypothetical protein n=1 Tax=Streptomyces sp. NWU339 TaxID=2185284 RepID=UPI000D67CF34|nr:hypothetical protein [Streptomyces sp. NWU339]PWI06384.1 hypothetical protein DIZ27_34085 [Streptomyces sp. NWU339]